MSIDHPRPLRWRAAAGITAGLLGTAAAFTAIAAAGGAPSPIQLAGVHQDQPGPCDEAAHANDPQCADGTSTTVSDDGSTTTSDDSPAIPDGATKTIDAAPAGTVVVTVTGGKLVVTSASPSDGWTLGEQRSEGREIEVRFLSATQRVDVKAQLEDGQIRSRVETRALTPGTSTTVPGDDHSGPGRGGADDPAGHDVGDDHGGQGNDDGANHDVGDDHGDDGVNHDVGDDHGDDGADHDAGDNSGSGSSGSGGHGGSGSGRDHPED